MKRLLNVLALMMMFVMLFTLPVLAQDNAAGPNDTHQTHDYAAPVGKSTDKKLSTGWTAPKGKRTQKTKDYVRHTKTGGTVHVHGYYHSRR